MEWLLGLAIAPAAVCGLMCVGGMVLAAVGIRRRTVACHHEVTDAGASDPRAASPG